MRKCHKCGTVWESEKKTPGVKEFCERCTAYLHCCLNCRFYDPAFHNQCAIPTTDWVGDKAGANFCDEFEFRTAVAQSCDDQAASSARQELDALFGEGDATSEEDKLDGFKKLFDE